MAVNHSAGTSGQTLTNIALVGGNVVATRANGSTFIVQLPEVPTLIDYAVLPTHNQARMTFLGGTEDVTVREGMEAIAYAIENNDTRIEALETETGGSNSNTALEGRISAVEGRNKADAPVKSGTGVDEIVTIKSSNLVGGPELASEELPTADAVNAKIVAANNAQNAVISSEIDTDVAAEATLRIAADGVQDLRLDALEASSTTGDLAQEVLDRIAADDALQANIAAEATARGAADAAHSGRLDTLEGMDNAVDFTATGSGATEDFNLENEDGSVTGTFPSIAKFDALAATDFVVNLNKTDKGTNGDVIDEQLEMTDNMPTPTVFKAPSRDAFDSLVSTVSGITGGTGIASVQMLQGDDADPAVVALGLTATDHVLKVITNGGATTYTGLTDDMREVVDVLTDNSPIKVLSANQGLVLKGLVDANSGRLDTLEAVDTTAVADLASTSDVKFLAASQGKALKDLIDLEEAARIAADNTLTTNLATEVTARTVTTDEVVAARGTEANLDDRLDAMDTDIAAAATEADLTTLENEVIAARGTDVDLDARLDAIELAGNGVVSDKVDKAGDTMTGDLNLAGTLSAPVGLSITNSTINTSVSIESNSIALANNNESTTYLYNSGLGIRGNATVFTTDRIESNTTDFSIRVQTGKSVKIDHFAGYADYLTAAVDESIMPKKYIDDQITSAGSDTTALDGRVTTLENSDELTHMVLSAATGDEQFVTIHGKTSANVPSVSHDVATAAAVAALKNTLTGITNDNLRSVSWDNATRTITVTEKDGDQSTFVIPDAVLSLVDNLTSTDATAALSAAQGKVLKDEQVLQAGRLDALEAEVFTYSSS